MENMINFNLRVKCHSKLFNCSVISRPNNSVSLCFSSLNRKRQKSTRGNILTFWVECLQASLFVFFGVFFSIFGNSVCDYMINNFPRIHLGFLPLWPLFVCSAALSSGRTQGFICVLPVKQQMESDHVPTGWHLLLFHLPVLSAGIS